jgi:acyl-CoA dehydrogenase
MDFELPEELRILKAGLRRFVDNELIPIERKTTDGETVKAEYLERFEKRAKELGIWQLDVPEEYGGGGMPILARAIVWEELSRTIAIPARGEGITGPSARGILYSLTGEMKEKYLLPLLRGEKKACFAQTEPDAGSDPGGMRTTAVRDGDHYVINGTKRFITGADVSDIVILMAATDRSKGSRGGISCFVFDKDTPGVKLTTCFNTLTGETPWEIVFDDVRIHKSHLVGKEGGGFSLGQRWLGAGRIKQGARALGATRRCLELASSYAKQRKTFGEPIANRQAIQWMIADSAVEIEALRWLVLTAAWQVDHGIDSRQAESMAKLHGGVHANQIVDRVLQIHGGMGYTRELPIERWYRELRLLRIYEGTDEIQRRTIARNLLSGHVSVRGHLG